MNLKKCLKNFDVNIKIRNVASILNQLLLLFGIVIGIIVNFESIVITVSAITVFIGLNFDNP